MQDSPVQRPLPLNFDPQLVQIEETRIESFKGPIPHPDILMKYDTIQPGLAERIVSMAEREQGHRHEIVTKAVDANIASDKRGQWMALTIAIAVLIVALVLGLLVSPWAGAVIGALDLAAVVGLFLKRDRDEKKASD